MKIIFTTFILFTFLSSVFTTTCSDGSSCPGTYTCCLSPQGTVGCCPYENAICCSDGLHCCPQGYACDLSRGQCVMGNNSFLAFISLNESSPKQITPSLKAFPDIEDLTKCMVDVYGMGADLVKAYNEYKKGTDEGIENAKNILIEILKKEVLDTGFDCAKVIEDILKFVE